MILISTLIIVAYTFLIIIFIIGWNRIPDFQPILSTDNLPKIAIVVACKNEEYNLKNLLIALQNQTFKNFELVLVNDHSSDSTRKVMELAQLQFVNLQIVNSSGIGKKRAIKEGILSTNADFIITTDADCVPVSTWIETIYLFQTKNPSDLIICPVRIWPVQTTFEKFQQIEFATLVGSGAGAAGARMPIMCNASNLAFTKKAWLESQNEMHEEQISGDDMFLMLSIKKRKGTIRYLKSNNALVNTLPSISIQDFIHQRTRWTSKSSTYTDWQLIMTATLILTTSLTLLILIIFSFFDTTYWIIFALFFGLKFGIDYSLSRKIKYSLAPQLCFIHFLLMSIIYPFYIVVIVINAILNKNHLKW